MKFKEKLTWILDKKSHEFDDDYQENIDFVHSLGKKCDCVGWSELDMDEPDAEEVLNKIQDFCKMNGRLARGWYERTYTDVKSDWFELKTEDFNENTVCDLISVTAENGKETDLDVIIAYHELSHSPKESCGICVPESFRAACIKNGITDVDFCWVQDKGRYEAEQYFYIYPQKSISRIICDKDLDKKNASELQVFGGYLPEIASIFHDLQHIQLQDCYLKEDMPCCGIAYVYCPSTYDFCGRYKILIHKDTAEVLVKEKALSRANLSPACIVDKCPEGYTLDSTETISKPAKEYIENCFKEYERLKAKGRPEYVVKEKDALKILRKSKAERKSEFNKGFSKKLTEEISDPIYNSILTYYQVCDGGLLSDEYTFLSYADSLKATEDFFKDLENEELFKTKLQGIVIAACINGDSVLVTENEKVIRFSHEAPEIVTEWQNIAKFFVEAINDNE